MSGRGKTGGKEHAKAKTHSSRAGLQLPIGRIHWLLHKGHCAGLRLLGHRPRDEILMLAGKATRDNKTTCIIPRYLQLAIRNNEELNTLLGEVTIAQGGVLPNIQAVLLPKQTSHPNKVCA
ncbi:histone H2AX-like [Cetorhinus maximus]